jgi:cell division protein ZapA
MPEPVNVRILDRDYLVACEPEHRPRLLEAAALLDERLRALKGGARTVPPLERMAVLAALNLANELIEARQSLERVQGALERIEQQIDPRIDRLFEEIQGAR